MFIVHAKSYWGYDHELVADVGHRTLIGSMTVTMCPGHGARRGVALAPWLCCKSCSGDDISNNPVVSFNSHVSLRTFAMFLREISPPRLVVGVSMQCRGHVLSDDVNMSRIGEEWITSVRRRSA